MEIKNFRRRNIKRGVIFILVAASLVVITKTLYSLSDRPILEIRASKGKPIDLEKAMKTKMVSVQAKDTNGKPYETLDYNVTKKIYDYNSSLFDSQIDVTFDSTMYPWDDCIIIEENGKLMALPVIKSKEEKPKNDNDSLVGSRKLRLR